MPEDTLIRVDNVSKKFCRSLRKSLWYGVKDITAELFHSSNKKSDLRAEEFWALRDVSFELKSGECLGLIGQNGAGKSTLLKLLNGLTRPGRGSITVRGKMGALIELGAGFNPVLTGRENVYINAAVLGIPKRKVDKIIDRIIDFSGIEEFMDTPVMSYSSGMKVRLGFAVAAELQPDIMLIDEVLAVGDLAFRTKCLNRLNEMKRKGMSFILVSHNMTNIVQFTNRAIWLDRGGLRMDGPSLEVTRDYKNNAVAGGGMVGLYGDTLIDHPDMREASVTLGPDYTGNCGGDLELDFGEYAVVEFDFKTRRRLGSPNISFPVYNDEGVLMTTIASVGSDARLRCGEDGSCTGRVRFGPVNLNPGKYVIVANLHDGPEHLYRSSVAGFKMTNSSRMTWGLVDYSQDWQVGEAVKA